jgi:ABC-type Na+ transport system ATPase subunit NatA
MMSPLSNGSVPHISHKSPTRQVRRLVGYCPQFDALCDLLTGKEHLELYARIKGVEEGSIAAFVESKIKKMDLTQYRDRVASTYRCATPGLMGVHRFVVVGTGFVMLTPVCSCGMGWDSRGAVVAGDVIGPGGYALPIVAATSAR